MRPETALKFASAHNLRQFQGAIHYLELLMMAAVASKNFHVPLQGSTVGGWIARGKHSLLRLSSPLVSRFLLAIQLFGYPSNTP
jgi:hypothetical protein